MESDLQGRYTHSGEITGEPPTAAFHEVRVTVPWGVIAGKWYGPQDVRPIVALHGWQDNAGSFDTLIPLLPKHVGYLALDFPGHGLSSHLPSGCYYNSMDNMYIFQMIMRQYKWDKISLLAHSMGSIMSFVFAGLYPELVDMVIGIDALKPAVRNPSSIIKMLSTRMSQFVKEEERLCLNSEPPSYSYDELIDKLNTGSFYSVEKNKCRYLLARNIKKSDKYPEKYYFVRDRRLKYYNYYAGSQELCVEIARRISCPAMFIKASNSPSFDDEEYYDEVLDVMKNNERFEYVPVKGTHHVHLNHPELLQKNVSDFICKYRPEVGKSKL